MNGNRKRFKTDAINRLMSELTAMDELDELIKEETEHDEFIFKTEPQELFEIDQNEISLNIQGKELTETFNRFPTNVTSIEDQNDDISCEEDNIFSNIKDKQEIMEPPNICLPKIGTRAAQLDYLGDISYKYLMVMLTKFKCFMCEHCPAFYKEKKNLIRHIHGEHYLMFQNTINITKLFRYCDKKLPSCLEDLNNKYLVVMLTKFKCFMCEHCPAFYKEKKNLIRHIHGEHYLMFQNTINITKLFRYCDKKLPSCLEDLNNKYLVVMLTKFKCFMCEHCPAFYKEKKDLITHIHGKHLMFRNTINITKLLHYCSTCDKKLPYKKRNAQMNVQSCKCELCGQVFKNESYFKKHVMNVDEKKRPAWRCFSVNSNNIMNVICPLCSKRFKNKQALHTHTKNCHSEKSYTCKVCNSAFKSKTYLNVRRRRVHYDDDNVHGCDLGNKQFKSPRYLRSHKRNIRERK